MNAAVAHKLYDVSEDYARLHFLSLSLAVMCVRVPDLVLRRGSKPA